MSSTGVSGLEMVAGCAIQETSSPLSGLFLHSWSNEIDGFAMITSLVLSLGAQTIHHSSPIVPRS